jgi:DNA polymerase sigma
MPTPKSSMKEKEKKETELLDSDLKIFLERIRLKNEALKKIYVFFEKEKKKLSDKENDLP